MQAATWLPLAKGLGVCGALAPEPSTAGDLGSTCRLWDHNTGLLRMGQSPVPRAPGKRAGEVQNVGTPASPSGGSPARASGEASEGPLSVGTVASWRPLPPRPGKSGEEEDTTETTSPDHPPARAQGLGETAVSGGLLRSTGCLLL